ncbi:MAG: hypothetical protein IKF79_04375, partial [Methanosphaera sp.]|nr:hypothetical protein [Methanosphaera sp.]
GIVYNNTVQGELVPAANAQIYNNTANSLTLSSNMTFANNTINGNVTIPPNTKNITLSNCTINGNVSVKTGDSSSSIPANITLENLQINGAINLTSKEGAVDTLTVKNNNITDGIYLSSKRNNQIKNVLIENNNITSNADYAIIINKTVTNVTIQYNYLRSANGEGINAICITSNNTDSIIIRDNPSSLSDNNVNIQLSHTELIPGKTTVFTVQLFDNKFNKINVGKVVFKINGKTVKDANGKVIYAKVVNGTASVAYDVPKTFVDKNVTILVKYVGSSKYNSTQIEKTVYIDKKEVKLNVEINDNVQETSVISLKATIESLDNCIINEGIIIFKIDGKTVKDANGKLIYVKVVNGVASIENYDISSLKTGTHEIYAIYNSILYGKIESTATSFNVTI